MARNQNPKIKDVEGFWEKFKKSHLKEKSHFNGEPLVPNMVESHIQGFGMLIDSKGNEYGVASHNNKGYSEGFMMYLSSKKAIKQYIPIEHFNHPGGIQIVGDYVFVAIENSEHNESYIRLCDLRNLFENEEPTWIAKEDFSIHMPKHGAAAVAATRYRSKDGDKVLIVPSTPSTLYIYQADAGTKLPVAETESILLATQNVDSISADATGNIQNLNLVTQENENGEDTVYMFVYIAKKNGVSFSDSMELWKFNSDNNTFKKVGENFHMKTSGGGAAGIHFRYGAGLQIKDSNILFYATQRNFVGGKMDYDTFIKK